MTETSFFESADETTFDEAFNILENSFPNAEYRNYENQKALLKRANYELLIKRTDKGHIIAIMGVWHLDDFDFIEHAAVTEKARGGGIGQRIFKEYFKEHCCPIILEVEDSEAKNAKRRIEFYKRLGFELTEHWFIPPALQEDTESPLPLYIMSYPEAIDHEAFERYLDIAEKTVYGQMVQRHE